MVFDHKVPHIDGLLTALNSQRKGNNSTYTLEYFIDRNLPEDLRHDIKNSLIQWERFVESIAIVNTQASFDFILQEIEESTDITKSTFAFYYSGSNNPYDEGLDVTYSNTIIWNTLRKRLGKDAELDAVSYTLYNIGTAFGLKDSSPREKNFMNPNKLDLCYYRLAGITLDGGANIVGSGIQSFSKIKKDFISLYGQSVEVIYGCTNPLASNYDSTATNNCCCEFEDPEFDTFVPTSTASRYEEANKLGRYIRPNNTYVANGAEPGNIKFANVPEIVPQELVGLSPNFSISSVASNDRGFILAYVVKGINGGINLFDRLGNPLYGHIDMSKENTNISYFTTLQANNDSTYTYYKDGSEKIVTVYWASNEPAD